MIMYSSVNVPSSYTQQYLKLSRMNYQSSEYLPCHSNRYASFLYLFPSGCRLGTAEQDCNSVIIIFFTTVLSEEQYYNCVIRRTIVQLCNHNNNITTMYCNQKNNILHVIRRTILQLCNHTNNITTMYSEEQ